MALLRQQRIEIGRRIRERRKYLKYKREEMAKCAGVSPSYYNQLEVGTSQMSIDTLIKLSQAMGMSTDHILFGTDKRNGSIEKITDLLSNCTQKELAFIENVIESYLAMKQTD